MVKGHYLTCFSQGKGGEMTHRTSVIEQASSNEAERLYDQHEATIINQMLQKLSTMDLPERERGPVLHAPQVASEPQAE